MGDIAYVVCEESSVINMYTADTLSPFSEGIHVEGMRDPTDIVACRHDRQLYVAANWNCIWRVSADDRSYVNWLPTGSPTHAFPFRIYKMSVTSRGLLVTSSQPPALYEYNAVDGQRLRAVQLPQFVGELEHGVETSRGTFVVGHRGTSRDKWQHAVSEPFSVVK